jgi:terminase small subunit-like protein
MAAGRPTKYNAKIGGRILSKIDAGLSVRKICAQEGMPTCSTVYRWLIENQEFSEQYAKSKESQAEGYAEEIIDISDEIPIRTVCDPDGGTSEAIDSAGVARNRLRVDARKWIASKLLPKKYGERIGLDHSGTVTLESLLAAAGKADE